MPPATGGDWARTEMIQWEHRASHRLLINARNIWLGFCLLVEPLANGWEASNSVLWRRRFRPTNRGACQGLVFGLSSPSYTCCLVAETPAVGTWETWRLQASAVLGGPPKEEGTLARTLLLARQDKGPACTTASGCQQPGSCPQALEELVLSSLVRFGWVYQLAVAGEQVSPKLCGCDSGTFVKQCLWIVKEAAWPGALAWECPHCVLHGADSHPAGWPEGLAGPRGPVWLSRLRGSKVGAGVLYSPVLEVSDRHPQRPLSYSSQPHPVWDLTTLNGNTGVGSCGLSYKLAMPAVRGILRAQCLNHMVISQVQGAWSLPLGWAHCSMGSENLNLSPCFSFCPQRPRVAARAPAMISVSQLVGRKERACLFPLRLSPILRTYLLFIICWSEWGQQACRNGWWVPGESRVHGGFLSRCWRDPGPQVMKAETPGQPGFLFLLPRLI